MISVDTNVLVRILVDDPDAADQMHKARSLFDSFHTVYVAQIVQVETVWVLESAYGFDKSSVCRALEHLSQHQQFALQSPDSFDRALDNFKKTSADFSDCLILAESFLKQVKLVTFDRKLARLKGVERL